MWLMWSYHSGIDGVNRRYAFWIAASIGIRVGGSPEYFFTFLVTIFFC